MTVSTAGHVMQLASLSEQQHQVLAALQHVMSRDPAVAPLSGCDLGQFRSAQDQASRRRLHQAEGGPMLSWQNTAVNLSSPVCFC